MVKLIPSSTPLIRPFLKWPGGKFRLISKLKPHLPARPYFIEPFVGAGALFLNTDYSHIILNDINPDLINLYQQIQRNGKEFIKESKKLFTSKFNQSHHYYKLREKFNKSQDLWEKAIFFLYLNRHGFNGLCRYNLKGLYNVPFGDYCRPYFPEQELLFFYQRSQNVTFHCENYVKLFKRLSKDTKIDQMVLYCDPPYAPLSKTAHFTGYAAHRFTLEDQHQLAQLAQELAHKGACVLISNHDTPFTRKIYHGAKLENFEVRRAISCKGASRQKVGELLAKFGPKKA